MSLSAKILLGLGLGIGVGIFFGERVAPLHVVGEVFIQLLQMAVLPFVTVSLMLGLGRLTYHDAVSLTKKCGLLLLVFWTMGMTMVLLMPLAFPDWESASFFSSALVQEKPELNFIKMYIPANPFHAFANTIVPAVVLFSIAMGIALIGVQNKQGLLDSLSAFLEALTRITNFVVGLAPIGVFAITASAAGTLDVEELGRLQVYLLTYTAVAFVLALWMLPGLVACLTPLTYREVVGHTRDALVTAFATGNLLVVLPILAQRSKELLQKCGLSDQDTESSVDVIVPASFNFPNLGTLLTLSFVLFAGWFSGAEVSIDQYPKFVISGFISFFGQIFMAMPFMLDLLRIPADTFQLFVTVDVLSGRFGTLLAAMHTLALALLGACAMNGRLQVRWAALLRYAAVGVILITIALGGTRLFFTYGPNPSYTKYKEFIEMDLLYQPVKAKVHQASPPSLPIPDPTRSRLDQIRDRGTLRVGFLRDSLPFAFRNAEGKLVGFDIEMAHILASKLRVTLEFVPLEGEDVEHVLNAGQCDIVMSEYAILLDKSVKVDFSEPYMDMTIAFIVEDHRRDQFTSWDSIDRLDPLKIGVPTKARYYLSLIESFLPQATVVSLRTPRDFFTTGYKELDAMAFVAEAGSAWTLVFPQFSVAVPLPKPVAVPIAYVMPRGERELVDFVNTWIGLEKKQRTIDRLFDYWILGKGAVKKEPRWSVVRNVLHWVD